MAAPGFQYFTSEDVGAPVLTARAGKLVDILDWALVGKGGWSQPFASGNTRVYRSDTGNRCFYRVDDTPNLYTRTRAYRNMTAISTGTFQFPTNTQATNVNLWGICKGYEIGKTHRYWGVRTNRFFVLFIGKIGDAETSGSEYRQMIAFGDFPTLCETDLHNTLIMGSPDISSYHYTNYYAIQTHYEPATSPPATWVYCAVSGTPSGAVASPSTMINAPFRGVDISHMSTLAMGGRLNYADTVVATSSSANGATPGGLLRGVFPQIVSPCSSINHPDNVSPQVSLTDLVPITLNGRTFLPILNQRDNGTPQPVIGVLLEITDTGGAL